MVSPRRYWLTVITLVCLWLATAWGWRETWIRARYEAELQRWRWEEQETRLTLARQQVDELLARLGLPKWWKAWGPPKPEKQP